MLSRLYICAYEARSGGGSRALAADRESRRTGAGAPVLTNTDGRDIIKTK